MLARMSGRRVRGHEAMRKEQAGRGLSPAFPAPPMWSVQLPLPRGQGELEGCCEPFSTRAIGRLLAFLPVTPNRFALLPFHPFLAPTYQRI